jgi:hypothetical protein
MRRAFEPPHRTCKPARSFDDSLAQTGLNSEQRRERCAAGDLGHFLLELDDSISECLAHLDSDARELPRGTRTPEDRSGRSKLTKISPQLLDHLLHGIAHILRGLLQSAAGDRAYTVISISRGSTLAKMLVEIGGINLRVMLVSGFAPIADLMNLFLFAHFGVVLLMTELENVDLSADVPARRVLPEHRLAQSEIPIEPLLDLRPNLFRDLLDQERIHSSLGSIRTHVNGLAELDPPLDRQGQRVEQ